MFVIILSFFMKMKISICVLTYNSADTLSECLDSILKELKKVDNEYEINVLNNGSNDHTEFVIKEKIGNIKYFKNQINQSFTKSYNFLLSQAAGDIYCITSDDIIFKDDIFKYLTNYYSEKSNSNHVVGPKTVLPNNNLDRINKKELNEKDLFFYFTVIGSIFNFSKAGLDQTKSKQAEVLQDSCLFFTNYIYDDFNFDERFKFYFTEDSLAKKLRNKNYKLIYDTNISVKHYLKVGTKKSKNTKMNMIYFKDCITYSRVYSNVFFHYLLFIPIIYLTIFLKYIKWLLNPSDYV